MYDLVIAIALGLLGGLLRIVIDGVVIRPESGVDDNENRVLRLGSLTPIIAGGAAGFVVWALTTNDLLATQGLGPRAVALTILAGIGGAEILLNYVNQQYGVAAGQQANQETGATAESQAKALENLTQQLSACQERERQLREELDTLRGETLGN